MRQWPRTLKLSKITWATTRLESTQARWFSWQSGRELDNVNYVQSCLRESEKMTLGSQGTYFGTGIVKA
jgi:hypothetical protein